MQPNPYEPPRKVDEDVITARKVDTRHWLHRPFHPLTIGTVILTIGLSLILAILFL